MLDIISSLRLVVLIVIGSVLLVRLLRTVESRSQVLISYLWVRATLGGLLVGIVSLFLPVVLGEGYMVIRTIIEEQYSPGLLIVGFAAFGKILATSLTLGTDGSGGIFAPCLVIGRLIGLFYQRGLVFALPSISWAGEGYFAFLGMAGVLSSVLQAPMTGVFLAIEITGSYELVIPVVMVSVIAAILSHLWEPFSICHQKLIARGELLRPRTDARVLAELSVMEILEKDCHVVHPEMHLKDFISIVQRSHRNYFPVVDSQNHNFLGLIHLDDVVPIFLTTTCIIL